jgi:CRISPR/Cas system-associated exonuclease Cas4 (RecB family)
MVEYKLPGHASYSQITTYLHCGEQFRLSRLMHLPEAPAWALVGGSAVHKASEVYDLAPNPDQLFPRGLFNDAFDQCIAEELVKAPEGFEDTSTWRASGRASKAWPNKEDERWWREHGPEFVGNWITWRQYSPLDIWRDDENNLAVELEATVEIAGLPVKVFIDRIMVGPNGLSVLDIKSGANMPRDGLQLAIYAHAMKAVYDLDVPYGQFWSARDGATSVAYSVSEYPMARLDYIFGSVRAMQEQGLFVANRTAMCVACGVRRYCRAFGGDLSHEVPQMWESPNSVGEESK